MSAGISTAGDASKCSDSVRGPRGGAPDASRPVGAAKFGEHVGRIREAKAALEAAQGGGLSAGAAAAGSMALVWEALFDTLCANPRDSLEALKEASGIVQRLTSAFTHVMTVESKGREKAKPSGRVRKAIPKDVLRRIEAELKLL